MAFDAKKDAVCLSVIWLLCRKPFKKNAELSISLLDLMKGSYEKKWKVFVYF